MAIQKMLTRTIVVISFITVFLTITAAAQSIGSTPANKTSPSNLESVLYQLSQATNPAEFASTHNIELKDSRVRVIIELKNQTDTVSTRFNITIETADKNLVQAMVPVPSLIELASEPYVKYIRAPLKPAVQVTSTRTANSDSLFLSLLATGTSLFYINKKHRKRP